MRLIGLNPFRTLQGKFTFFLSLLIIFLLVGLSYLTIVREKALMEKALYREAEALVESLAISCTNTMLYEEIGLVEEGGLLDNYICRSDAEERSSHSLCHDP